MIVTSTARSPATVVESRACDWELITSA
jgi:hypothetical protein